MISSLQHLQVGLLFTTFTMQLFTRTYIYTLHDNRDKNKKNKNKIDLYSQHVVYNMF